MKHGNQNDTTEPTVPKPEPVTPKPPVHKLDFGPVRTSGSPIKVPSVLNAVKGLDISHYQPKVNWAKVMELGTKFIFAKASDGLGSKDSLFETHRKNATDRGLIFGAYHFMRFGGINAKDEASLYLKNTGGVRIGELPLTLDVEWDTKNQKYTHGRTMDEAAAAEALEILERIEEATKITPIIYTSYPFFVGFSKPERFFRFIPWLPAYKVDAPKVPLPWSKWAFWQFTETHPSAREVTGDPNLDGDLFNGTIEQLDSLRRKS